MMLLFCGILISCKKDEINSKELLAYIRTSEGLNNAQLSLIITPTFTIGDSVIKIPAFLTRETSVDVDFNIQANASLVEAYNKANQKNYMLLPAENYKLNNNALKIKANASISSDSLKIQVINTRKLTNKDGYILPVTISEIQSNDKGVTISSNYRTFYLIINSKEENIDPSNLALTGANLDRTGWTVTSSGNSSTNVVDRILDGNNSTIWNSSGTLPAWIVLDMKASKTINGFAIVPNYTSRTQNFLTMEVLSSTDGVNWKSQGTYNGTTTLSTSSATNPEIKTARFYSPVTAQYFKFNITRSTQGSLTGMGELNAK